MDFRLLSMQMCQCRVINCNNDTTPVVGNGGRCAWGGRRNMGNVCTFCSIFFCQPKIALEKQSPKKWMLDFIRLKLHYIHIIWGHLFFFLCETTVSVFCHFFLVLIVKYLLIWGSSTYVLNSHLLSSLPFEFSIYFRLYKY